MTPLKALPSALDRAMLGGLRHWLLIVNLLWGAFVGLPWLAPVLTHVGHHGAAHAIYLAYSTQCHQLPQRSFFVFGRQPMYSLDEIQSAWENTDNPFRLRQFVGNPEMGWKVAWSDRMVSMYTSMLIAGVGFAFVRRRLRPLSLWAFALMLLPMAVDGATHFISDLSGIGQGFRDSNAWLAALTANALPASFYAGDGLGSFNSWMRLITGVLFGVGAVWLAFPHVELSARESIADLSAKAAIPPTY